jgi:hypothetical protein
MKDSDRQTPSTQGRRPWEPPALRSIGTVGQLVQTGMGKISAVTGDSGDPPFKPPGQG